MMKKYKIILTVLLLFLSARIFAQCSYTILTPPPSICKGNSVVLIASDTVNWTPASGLSSTYGISVVASPNVTTTYTIWKNGCSGKPTIKVTVMPNPVPVITGLGSICIGQSSVFDAGAGDSTYLWSTGATTQAITVSVSGTYSVTVTSFGNCTGSTSKTLTVTDPPSPVISGPAGICTGQNSIFDAGAGYSSYNWSTGNTTQTITVATAGTYTVTVSTASGCSGSVSKTLTVGSTIYPQITGPSSICQGASATFDAGAGYNNYSWSTGSTKQSISTSIPGTYTVTVIGKGGCTGSSSITLSVYTLTPPFITGPSGICPGQNAVFDAGAGYAAYNWSTGATTQTIIVSASGNYTVTVNNGIGCSASASKTLNVGTTLIPLITGFTSICFGSSTSFDAGAGYLNYDWSSGETTQTISKSISGTYTVSVTGAGGCTGSSSVALVVNPIPTPTISGPISICIGQSTLYDAGSGYSTYNWSNNATTQTINISAAGTYTVTVYNAAGCSASTSKTLTTGSTLFPIISGLSSICLGSLTSFAADSGYNSYIWSNGATTKTIIVYVAGTYTVTVSSTGGCTGSVSKTLGTYTLPPPIISGNTFICLGDSTELNATGGVYYLWSTSATTNSISVTPLVNSVYTVTAFDNNGCSSTASVTVNVNPPPSVKSTPDNTICNSVQAIGILFDSIPGSVSYWQSLNNLNIGFGLMGNDSIPSYVATNLSNQSVTDTIIVFATLLGCAGPNDTLLITVNPTPVINSIPDFAYCNDSLLNAGISFSSVTPNTTFNWISTVDVGFGTSGTGNILPFTTTNNTFYPITSTIIVNAEALGCVNIAAEVFTVTVNPTPETNPVSNLVFCNGNLIDTIFFSSNSPDSLIHWACSDTLIGIGNASGVNFIPSFVAANAGSLPITALISIYTESNSCTGSVTSFAITINPTPVVNPLPDIYVCDGDSVSEIYFSSQVLDSSFSWTSSSNIGFGLSGNGNILTFKANNLSSFTIVDTISVTATANDCIGPVSTFLITINPNPIPIIFGQSTICNGTSTIFYTDSVFTDYNWSTGSTNDSIAISTAGNYTVTVTGIGGCTASATKNLIVNSVFPPIIYGLSSICNGTSTVYFIDSIYTNYTWSDGSTNDSITVSTGGTYSVTVTGVSGCTSSASKELTLDSVLHPIIFGQKEICNGTSTYYYVDSVYTIYNWSNGSNNDSILVSSSGTYSVTVSDGGGCTGSASKTLDADSVLQPIIYGISTICNGTSTIFYTDSAYTNYSWSDGSTNDSISVATIGTYTVTVTGVGGCTGSASKPLTVDSVLHPVIYGLPTICNGTSTVFYTDSLFATYYWSDGSTNDSITVSTSGTYTVTVSGAGLCTGSATKTLTIDTILHPVIYGTSEICSGTSTTFSTDSGYTNYSWSNGATTREINVSVAGTYTVTVTGAGGCTGSVSKTININPLPIPIIYGPSTVCTGQIVTFFVDTIFDSYNWSTGGTTNAINIAASGLYLISVTDSNGCIGFASKTLIVDSILHPIIYGLSTICNGASTIFYTDSDFTNYSWSNGSSTDSISVSTNGTYTITVTTSGGCTGSATKALMVDSILYPVINGQSEICSGTSTLFSTDSGFTNYSWSNGATTREINVSVAGTYTVTVTGVGGCTGSVSKTININSLPIPIIYGPSTVCTGQIVSYYVDTIFENYSWSTGGTTNAIYISNSGLYVISITDSNGCIGSASKSLTVDSILHPVVYGISTICNGASTIFSTDSDFTNYSWSNGSSNDTILVTSSGIYTVTVTGVGGCTGSASKQLMVDSVLHPVINGLPTICNGTSTVFNTDSLFTTYYWVDGSTNNSITVSTAGTYTVTVTGAGLCTGSATKTLTVDSVLYPVIYGTAAICSGTSTVFSTDSGFTNYNWSNGATTQNINVSVAGAYTVTVTGVGGCTGSVSKTININPLPIPVIYGPSTVCTGQMVTYFVDTIFDSYNWSTGGTTSAINISTSSQYFITVADSNGCIGSSSKSLIVDSILHPVIYGDTLVCYGNSTYFNVDSGFINYDWSDGSINDSITVATNGTYTVTVTGVGGCTGTASKTLIVDSIGQTSVFGESPICAGASSIFFADDIFEDFIWSTGSTSIFISVSIAGIYTVTVSDDLGCTISASKTLILNALPTPAISGPSSICIGQSTVFDAGSGYVDYNWSTQETNQAITVSTTGIYSVEVTDTNGCSGSGSKLLIVDSILHPLISGDPLICDGASKILTGDTGYVNYLWSTGETSSSIIVMSAGTYTVTVTGVGGCSGSSSFTLTYYTLPPPLISGNTTLCIGDTSTLTASGGDYYLWSTGSNTDTILVNPMTATTYIVTATTIEGCSSVDSILINVNLYPVISNTPDDSVCNGTSMQGTNFISSLPLSSIYWYSLNNLNIGFGLAGYDSIPSYVANNLTSNSVTDTIIVYAVSSGCNGLNDTILITVKPTPFLYSIADLTYCNNSILSSGIPFGSPTPNTSFWWTSNFDVGFGTTSAGSIPSTTLTNSNYYPVTSTIIVSAQSLGCINDTAAIFTVTVNPTPAVVPVNDLTFCANITTDTIFLSSLSPDSLIHWSSSNGLIGLSSLSGTNYIPPFLTINASDSAVSAIISVYAESNLCIGDTSTFTITVNPLPALTDSLTDTICSGAQHLYNANSIPGTIFAWQRDTVTGVSNPAASGTSGLIVDTLINTTNADVTVHYSFSLSFNGCNSTRDYKVVVKPKPDINYTLTDSVFCSGEIIPQIDLSSSVAGTTFTWNYSNNIGINPLTGTGNIPADSAVNTGNDSIFAVVTINADANGCTGNSTSFKIIVRNLPPVPVIVSNLIANNTVCGNSSNISFFILNAIHNSSISYYWSANPANQITIGDSTHKHTTLSFFFQNDTTATVYATATYNAQLGGCSSTGYLNINVDANSAGVIKHRKIFEKNPGHILIYPDNSLDSYQWGFDPIDNSQNPPEYGQSTPIPNQVYQFYVPDSIFIISSQLDTINYAFWIMITKDNCRSKIYYNGKYMEKRVMEPIVYDMTAGIVISPNPNNGDFDITTHGNIYGDINLKIYDFLGQVIYSTHFTKKTPEIIQRISLPDLSNGIYLIELNSSDLKKLNGRFLIQH